MDRLEILVDIAENRRPCRRLIRNPRFEGIRKGRFCGDALSPYLAQVEAKLIQVQADESTRLPEVRKLQDYPHVKHTSHCLVGRKLGFAS